MTKIERLSRFLSGSHCMGEVDGLRDYHAARAVRSATLCRSIETRLARIKTALNPYRVTVALALDDQASERVRLHNRMSNETILL